jgi:hypothetical protein
MYGVWVRICKSWTLLEELRPPTTVNQNKFFWGSRGQWVEGHENRRPEKRNVTSGPDSQRVTLESLVVKFQFLCEISKKANMEDVQEFHVERQSLVLKYSLLWETTKTEMWKSLMWKGKVWCWNFHWCWRLQRYNVSLIWKGKVWCWNFVL